MTTTRGRRPVSELLSADLLRNLTLPTGVRAVELRRSAQRRKTVSARIEDDRIVLLLPATLTPAQESHWVDTMVARLAARSEKPTDADLARRVELVAARYLDEAAGRRLRPTSIRWVTNMAHRWGSCSTHNGQIRISHRLQEMPDWVLDFVLAHELVHLVEPSHGAAFKRLLAHYPAAERARGFLAGWAAASGVQPSLDPDGIDDPAGLD